MASNKTQSAATVVREEDLQDLEELLRDLQDRSDKARQDGRVFMLQQYIRLISMVSPEVTRVQRRFSRESLASLRKAHKELKSSQDTGEGEQEEA